MCQTYIRLYHSMRPVASHQLPKLNRGLVYIYLHQLPKLNRGAKRLASYSV